MWNANPSVAHGSVGSGTLEGGLNLTNTSGRDCQGYYRIANCGSKDGQSVCEPTDRGDWGTARMLWLIERTALAWRELNHTPTRIGIGHLSLQNGGDFTSYFTGTTPLAHSEHTNGLQADFRYVRKDTNEGAGVDMGSNPEDLDAVRNAELVSILIYSPFVKEIIIDSRTGVLAGVVNGVTIVNENGVHKNHFHVTIWDPDGTSN